MALIFKSGVKFQIYRDIKAFHSALSPTPAASPLMQTERKNIFQQALQLDKQSFSRSTDRALNKSYPWLKKLSAL